MDSTASKHKHVVVHAIPAGWGHNKPLCAFVVRMLEEQPDVVITYLTASAVYSKIMDEFKRLEPARFAAIEPRLNIMDIAGPDFDVMKPLLTFAPSLAALCSSGSVTCLTTKKVINGLPPPTLAIIDPFAAYAFESIRPIAGDSIRILAWWTATAGSLYRILGPAHLGGVADPTLETVEGRAAMKKKLLEREQIGWHDCVGNVVNIAGIEPSYDYEWFPQKTPILPIAAFLEKIGSIYIHRIQEEFGDKSLIYVSFGTVFWPEDSERVWAVIDGLIEKRQPFLFSHPSPFQKFPDEMKKKIEASGIAMELRWSPQELILKHPVTGWFITHGGWNSMTEAFIHRVPLIHWPFHADQPYNAMRMLTLKAGFELVEVRTGPVGARIPYKCKELPAFTPESAKAEIMSIVEKLKQEEGFVVRKNFEAVANAISKAWDVPDGQSRKDFLAMLKKFA
ncbi:glycosyltransferase family 1 protein [Lentinula edodes]|uniref:Glycosyltransferase family 1 protein n=1 Tax=Lentinula edodes TaxID=5353 RepID=A0A1Q3E8Q6_LENED|nr:glycosyltransferase family 1 protein [Lentinula edodes]